MEVLLQKGITNRVIIQSFDVRTLQIVHQNYPDVKTSLLVEEGDTKSFQEQLRLLQFTPAVYSPYYKLVNTELLEQCKAMGVQVIPWTVNDLKTIQQLKALGVDGIISDYPDLFTSLEE